MSSLKLSRNGSLIAKAGLDGIGNVSLIGTIKNIEAGELVSSKAFLDVAGMDARKGEILRWLSLELEIGDQIQFEIVEGDSPDQPISKKKWRRWKAYWSKSSNLLKS